MVQVSNSPRAGSRIGRFTLARVLGKGAQATVWLAHDPQLDREVALKLLHDDAEPAPGDATRWLHEARSVSRLNHPNIVAVFDAGEHEGQPYLVFEYVEGRTLAEILRGRSVAPAAREAIGLMSGVLDALQAAHAAGIVHRDLKPSNVVVDTAGRARVMDFGIAARSAGPAARDGAGSHAVVGTPGYMSPEAARGEAPAPRMDIFAAGVMLVEMLAGTRLIAERDPYRAMRRVVEEDLTLPAGLPDEVDPPLRALLAAAIARDAARRPASAAEFRDALQAWLAPPADAAPSESASGSAALDFLLRRMRHKSDFPALSDAVLRIQRVAASDRESVASLSAAILDDVALTHKLLRLVNSAHYTQGGGVSTVSRAVALVGFDGVRNLALSLVLLEHMHDKLHAGQLKAEFLRALLAGALASEFARGESEEAFIGAMLHNLGRLLTRFYFPEEARRVDETCHAAIAPQSEEAAAIQALGMSYEELGVGVARHWGIPESLQRAMRAPRGDPPATPPARAADRLRWAMLAANAAAQALLLAEPARSQAALAAVCERHAGAVGLAIEEMRSGAARACSRLAEMGRAMGLALAPGTAAQRLLQALEPAATLVAARDAGDPVAPHALDLTLPLEPRAAPVEAAAMLAAGIQDISNAMVENCRQADLLRMVLETLLRALALRRVVLCLREARGGEIVGRVGLGEGLPALLPVFRFAAGGKADLFALVCGKAADTMISDATAPHIAAHLPRWYARHVAAPAFLLLPLAVKGVAIGMIYADRAQPGGFALDAKELALLRTLRNQALMALRQQG